MVRDTRGVEVVHTSDTRSHCKDNSGLGKRIKIHPWGDLKKEHSFLELP